MKKRFLLFGYVDYYPSGGWNDFEEAYITLEEAITAAKYLDCEWSQIVDIATLRVVKQGTRYTMRGSDVE